MEQNLNTTIEESVFTQKYWEVQADIYESAAGWSEFLFPPASAFTTPVKQDLTASFPWLRLSLQSFGIGRPTPRLPGRSSSHKNKGGSRRICLLDRASSSPPYPGSPSLFLFYHPDPHLPVYPQLHLRRLLLLPMSRRQVRQRSSVADLPDDVRRLLSELNGRVGRDQAQQCEWSEGQHSQLVWEVDRGGRCLGGGRRGGWGGALIWRVGDSV